MVVFGVTTRKTTPLYPTLKYGIGSYPSVGRIQINCNCFNFQVQPANGGGGPSSMHLGS